MERFWYNLEIDQSPGRKIIFEEPLERNWLFHGKGRYAASVEISAEQLKIFVFDLFENSTYVYQDCHDFDGVELSYGLFRTYYWFGDYLVLLRCGDFIPDCSHLVFELNHEKRNLQTVHEGFGANPNVRDLYPSNLGARRVLKPTGEVVIGGQAFIPLVCPVFNDICFVPPNPFVRRKQKNYSYDVFNRQSPLLCFIQDFPFIKGSSLYSVIKSYDGARNVYLDRLLRIDLSMLTAEWFLNRHTSYGLAELLHDHDAITVEMYSQQERQYPESNAECSTLLDTGCFMTNIKAKNGQETTLFFDTASKKVLNWKMNTQKMPSFGWHPWGAMVQFTYEEVLNEHNEVGYELVCSVVETPVNITKKLNNLTKIQLAFNNNNRRICDSLTEKMANVLLFR